MTRRVRRQGWTTGEWAERGACKDMDPDHFFTEDEGRKEAVKAAREVCATCPVRGECLWHAMTHHEYGIWGGTTEKERIALRRKLRRAG